MRLDRVICIVSDRTLIYGKGGWVYYDGDAGQQTTKPGYITHRTGAFSGSVFGGGVGHMLSGSMSLKLEYLHFNFGTETGDQTSGESAPRFRVRQQARHYGRHGEIGRQRPILRAVGKRSSAGSRHQARLRGVSEPSRSVRFGLGRVITRRRLRRPPSRLRMRSEATLSSIFVRFGPVEATLGTSLAILTGLAGPPRPE